MINANTQNVSASSDADFDDISTDRPMYKPAECKDTPLQGRLIDLVQMPDGLNGPWFAFVVKTTAPTTAINRDGKKISTKPGDEVILPRTAMLADLDKYARARDTLFEARIQPTEKVKSAKGTMWRYKLAVSKKTVAREGAFQLTDSVPVAQLGAGHAESDDNLPI